MATTKKPRVAVKRRRLDPDKVKKLYLDKGLSQQKVALHLGFSQSAVGQTLRRLGVRPRPRGILSDESKKPAVYKKIKNLYVEKGWPQKRIASHLGFSQASIRTALQRMGVPSRPWGGGGYDGKKRLAIIKKLKDLYLKRGVSLTQAARRAQVTHDTARKMLKSEGINVPIRPPSPRLDPEKIKKLYLEIGWRRERIALHFGVSTPTIASALRHLGVAPRPRTILTDKAKRSAALKKIKKLYVEEEWTQSRIASHFGLSKWSITNALRRMGVPARPAHRIAKKRRSNLYDPRLASLDVGESFQIQVLDPYLAREHFLRLAKGINIRISTKKVGHTALVITRYE